MQIFRATQDAEAAEPDDSIAEADNVDQLDQLYMQLRESHDETTRLGIEGQALMSRYKLLSLEARDRMESAMLQATSQPIEVGSWRRSSSMMMMKYKYNAQYARPQYTTSRFSVATIPSASPMRVCEPDSVDVYPKSEKLGNEDGHMSLKFSALRTNWTPYGLLLETPRNKSPIRSYCETEYRLNIEPPLTKDFSLQRAAVERTAWMNCLPGGLITLSR